VSLLDNFYCKLPCRAIVPFDNVVDDDVVAAGMHYAMALPAIRFAVVIDFPVAINGCDCGSIWSAANHLLNEADDFPTGTRGETRWQGASAKAGER